MTPQLVNAGRIRMTYPSNKAADEHFENLRRQYADAIHRTRQLCDEAIDSAAFIQQSGNSFIPFYLSICLFHPFVLFSNSEIS